jgi:hypothetical protein
MFGNVSDWEKALAPKPPPCDHKEVSSDELTLFFLAHNPPSKQALVEKLLWQYRVIRRE